MAKIDASHIPQPYPFMDFGAVRIPTVIAPIPTKKITPKFTIPVYPVWRFNENDISAKMAKMTAMLDTWYSLSHLAESGSEEIGSQLIIRSNIAMRSMNATQDPFVPCLPYGPRRVEIGFSSISGLTS